MKAACKIYTLPKLARVGLVIWLKMIILETGRSKF
jgi:hypothetical protein